MNAYEPACSSVTAGWRPVMSYVPVPPPDSVAAGSPAPRISSSAAAAWSMASVAMRTRLARSGTDMQWPS